MTKQCIKNRNQINVSHKSFLVCKTCKVQNLHALVLCCYILDSWMLFLRMNVHLSRKGSSHQIHSSERAPGLASFLETTKCPVGQFIKICITCAIKEWVMGWPLKINFSLKNNFIPLFSLSRNLIDFWQDFRQFWASKFYKKYYI